MGSNHNHNDIKSFKWAFIINVIFTIIEIIGGYISNSIAITSDAIHDLGDSICLGFAYWSEKKAKDSERSDVYTYGMNRLPLVSALLNALILVSGSIGILVYSISRLNDPPEVHADKMIFIAILGVVFNTWAALKLHHNEGLNAKVASLHLLEDVLGWVAVLIGSIVIYFTGLSIIDPILSIVIACYILYNAFKNIREAYYIIMQKTPPELSSEHITKELMSINGINDVHDIHLWTLEGSKHILSMHVIVGEKSDSEQLIRIKREIREKLNSFGNIHATIEFEWEAEDCYDRKLSY